MRSMSDFLQDNARALVAAGILLLLVGILFKTTFFTKDYSIISSIGLFSGTVVTGIGFFALVEIYAADNVLGKAGGFLATASLFCFASLVLSISHRVIVGFKVYRAWHTGTYYFETPMKLELIVSYPLGWLFVPALIAGICLLAAGILLRAHSEGSLF